MPNQTFNSLAPIIMQDLLYAFPELKIDDVAAIMGNAGHESAGFTMLQEVAPIVAGSRGGWGWFQWTGPRRHLFEAYALAHGFNQSSYEANFNFLVHELCSTEKSAIAALCHASDLNAKVIAFEMNFERAGIKHYDGRYKWAVAARNAYLIAQNITKLKQAPSVVPQPKVVAPISVEIVKPAEPKKENKMLFPKISLSYLTGLYGAVVGALHLGSVIPAAALPSLGMIGAGLAITAWKRNENRKAFQDAEKAIMGQNLATALNNVVDRGVGALQDATGLTDASPTMLSLGGVVDSLAELQQHPSFSTAAAILAAGMNVVKAQTPAAPVQSTHF